ncbi:MAG: ferrous iron transporter B, partial [Acidobacteriota bacterium]
MFAIPVYLSYFFSAWVTENLTPFHISLAKQAAEPSSLLDSLLIGKYGLLSLGWASLAWACPLVALLAFFTQLFKDSGMRPKILRDLSPVVRKLGLESTDLIPVVSGFG